MSSFLSTPFNLLRGDYIRVVVSAINSRGEGQYSAANADNLRVRTVPDKMNVPSRLPTSTSSRFELSWNALDDPDYATIPTPTTSTNGGSAITSYFLEWDSGTNGASWS